MKEAYYFSHDSNARHDPKVLAMRSVYGAEGYGWYWIIIEMLRDQNDYQIELSKYCWNALAMQMQCDAETAHKFVDDCIQEFGLFISDENHFWSESLKNRMKKRDEKSEKAKKAAQKRWKKANSDKGSEQTDSESNAGAMQTQSKGNALKEKKGKESKRNTPPISSSSEEEAVKKIFHFWDQNGFGFGHTEMKNKLLSWLDDFDEGGPIILYAMELACESNKMNYSYLKKVLKNWSDKGVQTLEQAKAARKEFVGQNQRASPPSSSQKELKPEDYMF
ncbi:DnaD domain protein [Pseudalkalibacillus caeni]|uniref:DUF4373 domain-containing protein n=1 Tax=Exobacillus caeni TaxID=2574798 RepID=A0A5R9F5K5_9BACL|nr:Lin1244/Lin1753 domain-containing protein [Pseudalkalibacillus caeni]TLS37769.1 DUF4373 domain-containing protein [Pseudalkalibacillus caeni]